MQTTLETLPYKLSATGMARKIAAIKTDEELFIYANQLRLYEDLGIIKRQAFIRQMIHKRLDELYKKL